MHESLWPDEKSVFPLLRVTRQVCTAAPIPALAAHFQASRFRTRSFPRSPTFAARRARVEDVTSTRGNKPFELWGARKETARSRGRSGRAGAFERPAS